MRYELVFRRNVKHRNASGYQEIIIPKLKKGQNLKDGPDGYKRTKSKIKNQNPEREIDSLRSQ